MRQQSLRKLARELGISASYLSQVKNSKRPASQKVLSRAPLTHLVLIAIILIRWGIV